MSFYKVYVEEFDRIQCQTVVGTAVEFGRTQNLLNDRAKC